MIIEDVGRAQDALGEMLRDSQSAVAFTGAGLSTECGIPDFRSPDSAWKRHAPLPHAEFLASPQARALAWRRKFAMDDLYAGAQPGRGHRALARLMETGAVEAVITQNIDGLHQAAGGAPERIIELHGNGSYATCLSCGLRHELADIRPRFEASGDAPECACGGAVKSATIAFGQAMPEEHLRRARRATLACDLFIAIGSSLVVYPAAAFPAAAKDNGSALVIVNREPTPLDAMADLVLRGDIGAILEPFAA
ncbi:MAG: Silent information regulator protein Sir2 [Hyphomicrobiales bacterium]|nr:Silent information regulator protein Sir2 [Hyphomicrobiales bacterium]